MLPCSRRSYASVSVGLATLWLFDYYLGREGDQSLLVAQTVAFTCIVLIEKANVLNFRSFSVSIPSIGLCSNPWVLVAIATTIGLQVAAVYVPMLQQALHTVSLEWTDWAIIAALSAPVFVVTETAKCVIRFIEHKVANQES